jgi:hypothetical protein
VSRGWPASKIARFRPAEINRPAPALSAHAGDLIDRIPFVHRAEASAVTADIQPNALTSAADFYRVANATTFEPVRPVQIVPKPEKGLCAFQSVAPAISIEGRALWCPRESFFAGAAQHRGDRASVAPRVAVSWTLSSTECTTGAGPKYFGYPGSGDAMAMFVPMRVAVELEAPAVRFPIACENWMQVEEGNA